MTKIEMTILACLVKREKFLRAVIHHLQQDYFESHQTKILYDLIRTYFDKYNNMPPQEALMISLEKRTDINSDEEMKEIVDILDSIFNADTSALNDEWLLSETEKWCQDRSIYLGVLKSISILDGKEKNLDKNAIPDIMKQALSVTFDASIGHDYIMDSETRWNLYNTKENKIPFDLDYFNKITKGGVSRKTLNVILAGTGIGKTLLMCHMSAAYMLQGYNVLYITCEMAEERIAERIDANLMDMTIDEINELPLSSYKKKIDNIKSKTNGKIIIKEYPTSSANANHFRYLIEELEAKKNFKADVVIVDYINICASSRYKGYNGVNSYTIVKSIAEELRGLSVEKNVAMWTATQLNREGFDSSDPSLSNTAESFGLPATTDLQFVLISSEQLEKDGQIIVKQLKNRYNDLGYYRKFVLGVNKAKMKFFDVQESEQKTILDSDVTEEEEQKINDKFGLKPRQKKNPEDYSGFKIE